MSAVVWEFAPKMLTESPTAAASRTSAAWMISSTGRCGPRTRTLRPAAATANPDDLQAEAVEFVGQGGQYDRATRSRRLEGRSQCTKLVLEHLGEEVLVADLEFAPRPGFSDLPEERLDSLSKKWSDAEQRGVAGEGGRESVAVESPACLEGGFDDFGCDARGHPCIEGAAGAEKRLEIGLCEWNDISRPITGVERPVDQQQPLHLFDRVSAMPGLETDGGGETEFSFPCS